VSRLRVLVGCEFSGIVRDAFIAAGHDATSCDLVPSLRPGPHYQGDVRDLLKPGRWDLAVFHPPCTFLAASGARWFQDRRDEQAEALDFVRELLAAPIPRIALENPVGVIATHIRKADQIVQPWQFGHGETKATCFWLVGLPKLRPTSIVEGRAERVHRMPQSPARSAARSLTYPGIAAAMAAQWGKAAMPEPAHHRRPRNVTLKRLREGAAVLKTASAEARHGAFWTYPDTGQLAASTVCRRLERLGLLVSDDALLPGEGGQTYRYAPQDAEVSR
jgi:hypothetical protein